jgi:hypothetical protein
MVWLRQLAVITNNVIVDALFGPSVPPVHVTVPPVALKPVMFPSGVQPKPLPADAETDWNRCGEAKAGPMLSKTVMPEAATEPVFDTTMVYVRPVPVPFATLLADTVFAIDRSTAGVAVGVAVFPGVLVAVGEPTVAVGAVVLVGGVVGVAVGQPVYTVATVLLKLVTLPPFRNWVAFAWFVIGEEPTHGFRTVTGIATTMVPVNGETAHES